MLHSYNATVCKRRAVRTRPSLFRFSWLSPPLDWLAELVWIMHLKASVWLPLHGLRITVYFKLLYQWARRPSNEINYRV